MVRDLQVGMTIALPFREFHLPWLVLAEPVPVTPDHDDGHAPADPPDHDPGMPMSIRFFQTAVVDRLPRHYGLCSKCGGLSPCVDEWVEFALVDRESASTTDAPTPSPKESRSDHSGSAGLVRTGHPHSQGGRVQRSAREQPHPHLAQSALAGGRADGGAHRGGGLLVLESVDGCRRETLLRVGDIAVETPSSRYGWDACPAGSFRRRFTLRPRELPVFETNDTAE